MTSKGIEKAAFRLYNLFWGLAIPALRRNRRLSEGFGQRTLRENLPAANLWIQAASAGESHLARALIENLKPAQPVRVLLTSNTRQGLEILQRAIDDNASNARIAAAHAAYFPFDKPAFMQRAVNTIRPGVMVLLESEMWPGLLAALKNFGCKTLIINGRITAKSLNRYLAWPSLWQRLRPDKILAISENDAQRFAKLFGNEPVDVMPNIKFDRIDTRGAAPGTANPLDKILTRDMSFIVLGSVRREEESLAAKIIQDIRRKQPQTVFGLFPRHMHRVKHWRTVLERLAIPYTLRSRTIKRVPFGTVILWDTFGELPLAYKLAKAAFVGGSLAPLGGQNFLEPLTCGVIPVIGPFWKNFSWVGREIMAQGLVLEAVNWKEAADFLAAGAEKSLPRDEIRKAALSYMKTRRGGTMKACHLIEKFLNRL